jgi:hypothetical protein
MTYLYKIDKVRKNILVNIKGDIYTLEFAKLDVEVLTLALNLNYKIIFNFKSAIIRIGFGEAYFWFSKHLDNVNLQFRRIPTAHIANDSNERFFYFVETAWSNQGVRIKMFKNDTDALEWMEQFK